LHQPGRLAPAGAARTRIRGAARRLLDHEAGAQAPGRGLRENATAKRRFPMGKYFLAWLLGVPVGLLVLIFVFTHLF